jgi:hypothetical protein
LVLLVFPKGKVGLGPVFRIIGGQFLVEFFLFLSFLFLQTFKFLILLLLGALAQHNIAFVVVFADYIVKELLLDPLYLVGRGVGSTQPRDQLDCPPGL